MDLIPHLTVFAVQNRSLEASVAAAESGTRQSVL